MNSVPLNRVGRLNSPKIVIFTALKMEASAVRRVLPAGKVFIVGVGAKRLPSDDELVGVEFIIMAGLAGALDPGLKIGDVVIDDRMNVVKETRGYLRGTIWTSERIVGSPAEKAELFRRTGALAVEMEGAVVGEFAKKSDVPFLSVRAISDTADEVLDPAVVGFVDEVGRVRPLKLAAGVVRRPGLVPYLNRLGKNSRMAAERLGIAVRMIVESLGDIDGKDFPRRGTKGHE